MRSIVVLLALMATFDASACSCTSTPLSEKVDQASFVGVVRVESTRLRPDYVEFLKQEDMEREGWLPILADFTPAEVLKGDVTDVDALATGFGGGDCGITLVPGYDYLVIGDPDSGEIGVVLCSGSEALGPQSLVASLPDADRWEREQPRLAAIKRQIEEGEPVPECLDNNPRFYRSDKDACEAETSDSQVRD